MIKQFIPKEYRYLLDYISPAAFKVVDWKGAVSQFLQLSKHALDKQYGKDVAAHNLRLFPSCVDIGVGRQADASVYPSVERARLVLDIYFSQFFSGRGVLLDLRPGSFSSAEGAFLYDPGVLVHTFTEEFRKGMLAIYAGYYLGEPEQMAIGMQAVGLVQSADPSERAEIEQLLFAHFGRADQEEVVFSLQQFKNSFHALFLHLKSRNIKLEADFLFLGVYLVTLYLAMEELGCAVDVKSVFLQSWQRNNA